MTLSPGLSFEPRSRSELEEPLSRTMQSRLAFRFVGNDPPPAFGTSSSAPAQAYSVRRLDREGEFYYLVLFGEPQATVAVATVNAARVSA